MDVYGSFYNPNSFRCPQLAAVLNLIDIEFSFIFILQKCRNLEVIGMPERKLEILEITRQPARFTAD